MINQFLGIVICGGDCHAYKQLQTVLGGSDKNRGIHSVRVAFAKILKGMVDINGNELASKPLISVSTPTPLLLVVLSNSTRSI